MFTLAILLNPAYLPNQDLLTANPVGIQIGIPLVSGLHTVERYYSREMNTDVEIEAEGEFANYSLCLGLLLRCSFHPSWPIWVQSLTLKATAGAQPRYLTGLQVFFLPVVWSLRNDNIPSEISSAGRYPGF